MIAQLRKRHVYIWSFLALALPVAIFAAYAGIPTQITDKLFQTDLPAALPEQMAYYEKENIILRLRGDKQLQNKQLEIILTKPLMGASTLVYVSDKEPEAKLQNRNLIGIVGTKGIYRLSLPKEIQTNGPIHITLYDAIKAKTIHSIHLQL